MAPIIRPALPAVTDPKIWRAAQQYEAMTLSNLLQPMFDTVDLSKSEFGGGAAETAWKPMLVNEIAKQIGKADGLGLAPAIYRQMLHLQEALTPQPKAME